MCLISWERTQKRDQHKLFQWDFGGQKRGPKRAIFGHKKFSLLFFPTLAQRTNKDRFPGPRVNKENESKTSKPEQFRGLLGPGAKRPKKIVCRLFCGVFQEKTFFGRRGSSIPWVAKRQRDKLLIISIQTCKLSNVWSRNCRERKLLLRQNQDYC